MIESTGFMDMHLETSRGYLDQIRSKGNSVTQPYKRNEIVSFVTWVDLKGVMLSEVNKTDI